MRARLWFAVLMGYLASSAWGQQDERIQVLASGIADLNGRIVASGGERSREFSTQRSTLLSELIALDPARALTFALPEELAELSGSLTGIVYDDFENKRSSTVWRLRTADGEFETYFAGASPRGGSTVTIRGLRAERRLAVSEVLAGSSAPASYSPLGEQTIAVLLVTMSSYPAVPAWSSAAFHEGVFFGPATGRPETESLKGYWERVSNGAATATGQVFGPLALSQDYTCSQSEDLARAAVKAFDSAVDLTRFAHLAIVFPASDCFYAGMSTLGSSTIESPSKGSFTASMTWFPATAGDVPPIAFRGTVAHELGHALGLDHARTADYGAVPIGALDGSAARVDEYGDSFSVMGSPTWATGYYSAAEQLRLGWLNTSEYHDVASEGTFVLRPLESSGQPRALRVLRNSESGDWLWLEYRQPIGVDNSLYGLYRGFIRFGATAFVAGEAAVFRGALIRHENSDGSIYLLDFTPMATPNDFSDAPLAGGQSWSDPYSPVTISVGEPTLSGLPVTVKYDQPCASTAFSDQSFDAQGGDGYINIFAPAGCEWAALTNAGWISIDGPASGRGSGTVRFRVSPNTGSRRTGYIAVGRQSTAVAQTAASPSVLSVTPNSGEGASSRFTFEFSQSTGMPLTGASLRFTGPRACQAFVNVEMRSIALLGKDGTAYLPSIPVGAGGTSNGVCTIAGSSITPTAGRVSIALDVVFTADAAGGYTISAAPYLGGWVTLGTWLVPRLPVSSVTIMATAPGAPFSIDGGKVYHAPATFNWEPGERHTVEWMNSSPDQAGLTYSFRSWLDGEANPRTISAIQGQAAYTANVSVSGMGYIVQTVAGGRPTPSAAPALAVALSHPYGVAVDRAGNTFVSCPWLNLVYRIDAEGIITRFAGTGVGGYSGDGGPAIHAQLFNPRGLSIDSKGNLLIADTYSARIRKVSPDGTISTVAGVACCADWGDGGPAISAWLGYPVSVAADSNGGFYIAQRFGINYVDPEGIIHKLPTPADAPSRYEPTSVAVDSDGNVYIAVFPVVFKRAPDGTYTVVDPLACVGFLTAYNADQVYASGGATIKLLKDGKFETIVESASHSSVHADTDPQGIAVDQNGFVYFADEAGQRVRKFKPGGEITTIAGAISPGEGRVSEDILNQPKGIAVDEKGNVYIADTRAHRVRKISPNGIIATVAGTGIRGSSGDGGRGVDARLSDPTDLAIDGQANLYISDSGNGKVRKLGADGTISTVYIGREACTYGIALDTESRLYVSDLCARLINRVDPSGAVTPVAGNGVWGSSGDNGPATSASIQSPWNIAVDRLGNLYMADGCRVRKVATNGIISTIAITSGCDYSPADATIFSILGLAADSSGNLYFGDHVQRVGRLAPSGAIDLIMGEYGWRFYGDGDYTGDGGPAKYASLRGPEALALDQSGNIYVAEADNLVIRKLTPSGVDPVLAVSVNHERRFTGSTGEYSIKVTNALFAAATRGPVTVTELLPAGLSLKAMYGEGWACTGNTCTRSDTLSGGSYPRITVAVDISQDAPSQVTNQVIVTGGGAPPAGAQDFTEVGDPPSTTPEGVVNAATYVRGAATGGLVSIFGQDLVRGMSGVLGASGSPLPLQLGGTAVTLGDRVLPILAVASFDGLDQINVQIPYGLGGQNLPLRVSSGGLSGNSIDLQVLSAQPGIFMVNSDAPAVVHGNDYSLVTSTNPAKPGEFVAVYCTGLGEVSPPVAEGTPAPVSPLSWTESETTATIGGARAEVQFAGLAPGFAGLYQVNVRIPEGTPSGPANLVITTSGASSQTVPLVVR